MEKKVKYYYDAPQTEGDDSLVVLERFFFCLSLLQSEGILRGVQTFTNLYDINRRNFQRIRGNVAAHQQSFRAAWMTYLVRDFKVSPLWLLTGEGEVFREGWTPEAIRIYRRAISAQKAQKKSKGDKATS